MASPVTGFLWRYATPFTTGLFLVSTISGLALFLHIGTSYFHEMHEILSLVLIVPFAFHLWRNWPALVGYFKRGTIWVPLALSLAVAVPFALEGAGATGGNPAQRLIGSVQKAPLSEVAAIVDVEGPVLIERLAAAGIAGATLDDTIAGLAAKTGQDRFAVMAAINGPAS
ncbi:DUF4405 domain-containing protein [Chthonobacter albigriseus]|uniref:DUF4405 domain-containing protein n=1 Tax=Chthonobacter albigriseus TaxID=1683161 RepID=UPI0015EEFDD0|nr:DUF4405 domain-containing protein [Chthonobacter albigriseus]